MKLVEDGSRATRTTFRSHRHHRRGPRLGNGVLRRAGSRGRGHRIRGGRVRRDRLRHPGRALRDRDAAAARRRVPAGALELRHARPRARIAHGDGQRAWPAQRVLRGRRPRGGRRCRGCGRVRARRRHRRVRGQRADGLRAWARRHHRVPVRAARRRRACEGQAAVPPPRRRTRGQALWQPGTVTGHDLGRVRSPRLRSADLARHRPVPPRATGAAAQSGRPAPWISNIGHTALLRLSRRRLAATSAA